MIGNKIITKKLLIILFGIIIGIVLNNSTLNAAEYNKHILQNTVYPNYHVKSLDITAQKTDSDSPSPFIFGKYRYNSDTSSFDFEFAFPSDYDNINEFFIIKDSVLNKEVTKINSIKIKNRGNIKTAGIHIPNTVDKIDKEAFASIQCRQIRMPNSIKTIPERCFYHNTLLEKIILPSKLKRIDKQAFIGCEKLETIKIPDKVKTIEKEAFKDCKSLKQIYLPASLKKIEDNVFENCEDLTIYCEKYSFAYNYAQKNNIKTETLPSTSIYAEKITNLPSSINIGTYEEFLLFPTLDPFYSSNHDFLYISNDPTVAEVNQEGKIEGKKMGTTTITVMTKDDSNLKKEVEVVVQHGIAKLNPYFSLIYAGFSSREPTQQYHFKYMILNKDPKAIYKIKQLRKKKNPVANVKLDGDLLHLTPKRGRTGSILFELIEIKEGKERVIGEPVNFYIIG